MKSFCPAEGGSDFGGCEAPARTSTWFASGIHCATFWKIADPDSVSIAIEWSESIHKGQTGMAALNLVVISGLSGSGKSHALKCFEDVGHFCIENSPPAILPTFVELCHQQGGEIKNVALGIDVRERVFFSDLVGVLKRVKALGHTVELIFFEAREEVLVRRFSESRRPHPLLPHLPVLEGVRAEKERLADLRRHADRIIDTSDLTVHELRELLDRQFIQEGTPSRLTISLVTFGYKFGVPYDIDLLFDVRFCGTRSLFLTSNH